MHGDLALDSEGGDSFQAKRPLSLCCVLEPGPVENSLISALDAKGEGEAHRETMSNAASQAMRKTNEDR